MQNSISERVSQKQLPSSSGMCYPNDANPLSQGSINPSEDDTNLYPPSSISYQPGDEDVAEKHDIAINRYKWILIIINIIEIYF